MLRSRNLILYFAPTAYQKVAPLLALPVLSAFLGPEVFGRSAILTTVFMLAQVVLGLGLDSVIFYYYSRGTKAARLRRIANATKIALVVPASMAVIVSALALISGVNIAGIAVWDLIISVCAGAIYASAASVCLSLFRVENRLVSYATLLLLFTTVQILSKLFFVIVQGWGVRGWVLGDFLASIGFFVFCLPTLYRRAGSWSFSRSSSSYVLQKGLPLVPSQLFQWVAQSSDRILVGLLVGGALVGTYSLGAQFGGAGLSLMAEACRFFMRTFSRASELMGREKTVYLRRSVSLLLLVIASIAAVVGPVSQVIISAFFAEDFLLALGFFPSISFAIFVAGLNYILIDYSSVVHGATSRIWVSSFIGAVGMVGGNIWLLPVYGVYVVPWVTAGSYLIAFVVLLTVTRNSKAEILPSRGVTTACVLLLAVSACVCVLFAGQQISLLGAAGSAGMLGLAGALLVLRAAGRGSSTS